jgi:DNA-binding transcriptional ArsR family regulator
MSTTPAPADDPPRKRGRNSGPLDRVLHALNHPVRRQILRALTQGSGSASSLAREFKMSLGVVSYHLNQVLANECEVVELVAMVPRRGAVEKFYKLKRDALTGLASELEVQGPLRGLSLEECLLAGVEAIDASVEGRRDGGVWEWFSVELDAEGWQEVQAAQADFNRRLVQAAESSRSRGGGGEGKPAVVGAVALPLPVPPAPDADD